MIRSGIMLTLLVFLGVKHACAQAPPAAAAVEAWSSVRRWVDAGQIPRHGRATPPGVDGVAVQLTWNGRLVGADEAHAAAGDADPLAKAARGAVLRALANEHIASLPEAQRVDALSDLMLEVEVSGIPEPLTGPLQILDTDIHPGHDGIAVRRGDQWSMRFPSRLRSRGRSSTLETLRGMLLLLGVHEAEADALRRSGEVTVYKLPTIDLREVPDGRFPEHFARGRTGSLMPVASRETVDSLSDRLAVALLDWYLELMSASADSTAFFAGTWDPNLDKWGELIADDSEIALASLALARWAETRPDHDRAGRAIDIARIGLTHVTDTTEPDPRAVAVAMVAANHAWTASDKPPAVHSPRLQVLVTESAKGGKEPTRAIATLALALHGETALVKASIETWLGHGPDAIAQTMPWSMAAARAIDDARMDPHIDLLREILLGRQLDAAGGAWGPEAAGAVALQRTPVAMGFASLRAGWALAAMAADLPPTERALLRERLLLLATHVQRRTIDADTAATWASPDRAVDRIRWAPWDERLSISAQALALLTTLDIAEALDVAEAPQESPG